MYDRRPPAADRSGAIPSPPRGLGPTPKEAAKALRLAVVREAVRLTTDVHTNASPSSTEVTRKVKHYTNELYSFVMTGYWSDGSRPQFAQVDREETSE